MFNTLPQPQPSVGGISPKYKLRLINVYPDVSRAHAIKHLADVSGMSLIESRHVISLLPTLYCHADTETFRAFIMTRAELEDTVQKLAPWFNWWAQDADEEVLPNTMCRIRPWMMLPQA